MPIYEYECQACHHQIEAIQKFSDPPLTDCPECGKKKSLSKMISATGFQLTGSGWYVTDFKDKKPQSTVKEGSSEVKQEKVETKTEQKVEKKVEKKSES